MSADILFRMKRYSNSAERYSRFLGQHIDSIAQGTSGDYLMVYATFFYESALRNSIGSLTSAVTLEHLRSLSLKAGMLERGEFPPPKP